ncbi:MAG: DNA-directed RNA polymerase subunit beta [Leptotrichiaceae bacterium]|nr:DNA-directed RNA polymerase subunit beta [Leptotrichiaceae bacterium]MBP6281311.1 DNA-directed RNA polymerase subunit beta [Leptotrichiaceae bacterium]MBP7100611.1 DNA-directed RNA polymerase subunit beta [Leptotrichiaceae bacterium]MBP7739123.1 DNA-directed RNA polymerase subunit beta [Leptotrichiaceae bacterium]MBP9629841.1 DNA-directed RNA polymerase subunit beta [Leptotrichiaceae bacterium]
MNKLIERYSFGKIVDRGEMPHFLEFQVNSYEDFLQAKISPQKRENKGFEAIFNEIFPIESSNGLLKLEYLWYEIHDNDEPLNDELECKKRGKTYSGQLKVRLKLTNKRTQEIQETLVHFGDIPLMTEQATFVINGAERVVVSQLHRSPGITFNKELNIQTGKDMFIGKIIPYKGTWLEFETDKNDILNVKIDRRKKVLATVFLKAVDFFTSNSEIMDDFFEKKELDLTTYYGKYKDTELEEILKTKIEGSFVAEDILDEETGEFLAESEELVDNIFIEKLIENKIEKITIWEVKPEDRIIANALIHDTTKTNDEAVIEVFRKLRPGDLVTVESARSLVKQMFFNPQRYDLADVGRYKINVRLKLNIPEDEIVLTKEDVLQTINYVKNLLSGEGYTDDIDNLSNRRVRGVGELLSIQIKGGMLRMAKMVKEKMTIQDITTLTPQSLLNTKPLNALIIEFFGSGQLSQFMDQSNPLAELTHKRRISALGPGGLSRERAGFEVRDVHNSHYGRICPIETPEGPNIGLIGSLSTYGKVNKYGFIETPFVKIENGKADFSNIKYLGADEEEGLFIAQADTLIDEDGNFLTDEVVCRYGDEIVHIDKSKVDLLDVSPKQLVSVSAGLIPFLEHDDANRALMGSNMQRQAVPLLKTEAPFVGTGLERKVAIDSGAVVTAKATGEVTYVDARKIIITDNNGERYTHRLLNFEKSNSSMSLHQKPLTDLGTKVKKGEVIADGPSTAGGDLALGKNILLAFMPWEGYNFEDGILISERLRKDDVFTSLHIEDFEIESRTTKLGDEEITREIPNVSEESLRNLDENGIIRIGSYVTPDDILVGKVTPKGESEPPAEEKLLRAIFGEKAKDVRDTSLRLPHGVKGTVVDVLVLTKESGDDLKAGVNKVVRIYIAEKRKIMVGDKMSGRHGNKGVVSRVLPIEDMPHLENGTPIDVCLNPLGVPSRMNIGQVLEVHLGLAIGDINKYIATPVFDGAKEEDVKDYLEESGYSRTGKVKLIDGRSGQPFDNPVTVGRMYMLKLHHLVEDKMHARAIGPYSLVTQQPLGGKAQFGGQRLGEMEVWALEAYGASNILQEMLTVKSDDINGRTKTYEAIVKGQAMPEADAPESFRVLIKEFQSLGLDVALYDKEGEAIELDKNIDA